jgi:SAM-dependent methyltransferase
MAFFGSTLDKLALRTTNSDRVVIVDFLEHIPTDNEFAKELFRILKPDGELIVNVPYTKKSLLRKFCHAIGETDEKHGHVRPGYTIEGLTQLFQDRFTVVSSKTYSKFFSECIDTLVTFACGWLKKGEGACSKGLIVTDRDLQSPPADFPLLFVHVPTPLVGCQARRTSLLDERLHAHRQGNG